MAGASAACASAADQVAAVSVVCFWPVADLCSEGCNVCFQEISEPGQAGCRSQPVTQSGALVRRTFSLGRAVRSLGEAVVRSSWKHSFPGHSPVILAKISPCEGLGIIDQPWTITLTTTGKS